MIERAVITDFGGFPDHHAHAMIDKKALADFGTRVDFDTRQPAGKMREKTRQPFQAEAPQPVVDAVHD
jgi:hypothetical protein